MIDELGEAKLRHPSNGMLQEVIATNAVRAFNEGFGRGRMAEQERVLDVVKQWRKELLNGNHTLVVERLIELIKGE
jgi:hypothetical protein